MANDTRVKGNIDELERIIKSLKNPSFLRVGIIGSKANAKHDKESGLTNADLGAFHEFGTKKMPRRSFLEDVLKLKLNFNSEQFKDLRKVLFKQVFDKHAPEKFLQNLGAKCLEVIEQGFDTNGFGMWQPLSRDLRNKRDEEVLTNLAKMDRRASKLQYNLKTEEDLKKLTKLKEMIIEHKTKFIEYGSKILTDTGKMRHSISFKIMRKK